MTTNNNNISNENKNTVKNAVKMKAAVEFISTEPTTAAKTIRKDVKKMVECNSTSGKWGPRWYALKPTDEEDVYDLTVETIKKQGKDYSHHFDHYTVRVTILNRIWEERTTPGGLTIKVPRLLTTQEMKAREKATQNAHVTEAQEIKPFFTAGTRYRCIKGVKGAFTMGKIYEQSSDPTPWYGYFVNDKGTWHVWSQPSNIAHDCETFDYKPEAIDPRIYFEPVTDGEQAPVTEAQDITESAEGIKVGDHVKHCWTGDEVATVTDIRRARWDAQDGEVWLYRLDFGRSTTGEFKSVLGPFKMEMNGGEYRREALTPCTPDGRELLPEPPAEITIDADTLETACEITDNGGDVLPDCLPESVADTLTEAERMRTARHLRLGDRVRIDRRGKGETGRVTGFRMGEPSTKGWTCLYDVTFDDEFCTPTGCGTVTGAGNFKHTDLTVIEPAGNDCPERDVPDFCKIGCRVALPIDQGDTVEYMVGTVRGWSYEQQADGTREISVYFGGYHQYARTLQPWADEVKTRRDGMGEWAEVRKEGVAA